jgi:hypothetical protein
LTPLHAEVAGATTVEPRARATAPRGYFRALVEAETVGEASPADLDILRSDEAAWAATLAQLLVETDQALVAVADLDVPERGQILADFLAEQARLEAALQRVTGAPVEPSPIRARLEAAPADEPSPVPDAGIVRLQGSWSSGQIVAWAGGPGASAASADDLAERLAASGAAQVWGEHRPVPLPDGAAADALTAPAGDVLGWLVALGGDPDADAAPSLRWLGALAVWAVELVAHGHMVPALRQPTRRRRTGGGEERRPDAAPFSVRWEPALIDQRRLAAAAAGMPAAVAVFDGDVPVETFTQRVLSGMVHAICRIAAERVETPAASPRPQTAADAAEAVVAHFDGTRFDLPSRHGGELSGRLERWARPVTNPSTVRLVVELGAPDGSDLWPLAVHAAGVERELVPVEVALVTARADQRRVVEGHLHRLERLLPLLRRPGGQRRGEVLLSQAEAWDLMTDVGATIAAAGFDVRVPQLSRRRHGPSLRLTAETSQPSVVGARQLASVRWSAVFDDVELDAADIARLAAQARPLVRSRGRWVALDHADLAAAASALADRAGKTQLTGAEMLRHALGLEGSPLEGGISVTGEGWAVDLLHRAASVQSERVATPAAFRGELRSYQSDAISWLAFLDTAGLGGCLALDMGLGKTPTVLAHLLATRRDATVLVIAPPAVVGNWAKEAARFAPDLRVVIHHGTDRAEGIELTAQVAEADVILTTYGTAVRDVDALAEVTWDRIVIDEAQAIKNPASETARLLRRIPARTRLALTGTPIENGLGDLWAILDFTNPGLVGSRAQFVSQLSRNGESSRAAGEDALRALNGLLVFRRTKSEPSIAAELPERVDELDHCTMTAEQIGLYQAVVDDLVAESIDGETPRSKGRVLAAITALKQICNHPAAYRDDGRPLEGRSGKLSRLEEIVEAVFAADERVLIFTHFAQWGVRLAEHLTKHTGIDISCYHGGLPRGVRDRMIADFQATEGPGALVLSLKAGGTGLNLTAASHVVLYDRWWNPAVEDQARDRAWRIGQSRTVIAHRLVCPGTIDERVEEVVAGKRKVADLVLPASSSLDDLDADQLRAALGLRAEELLDDDSAPDRLLEAPDQVDQTVREGAGT